MPLRGKFAAILAALIGALALAGTAHAATTGGEFSCRASAARATTFGNPPLAIVEPVRANVAGTPCVNSQSAETVKPTTIGPITADAVRAYTTYNAGPPPAVSSDAIVTAPRIVLGGLTIGVDAIEAHASATCKDTTSMPTLDSSSKVVNLTINGNTLAIPANSQPFNLNLAPLVTLHLNEKTVNGNVVTQRAVHITAIGNDVVVGEAIAGTATGNPCQGVTSPTGSNTPCPTGSTFDATRNACIIVDSNGKVIIVAGPFQNGNGHIGTANGPLATCAKLTKDRVYFASNHKQSITKGYRARLNRVVIRGVLVSCGSHPKPIIGAQLDVIHVIRGKRHQLKTGVKSRAHGRFTLIEPRNIRTRTIEFAYRPVLTSTKVGSRITLHYTLKSDRTGKVLR
jgi:hypothetical protein